MSILRAFTQDAMLTGVSPFSERMRGVEHRRGRKYSIVVQERYLVMAFLTRGGLRSAVP